MEALLNFNAEHQFDIALFEDTIRKLYEGSGAEQQAAQSVISRFQEHPDAWTKVDLILEYAKALQSKFVALQILEKLIQTRWNALPREQCLGIRNYILNLIIKYTTTTASNESNPVSAKDSLVLVNKLNIVLVRILKHEWPRHWPTFIPELIASSHTSLGLCENNMIILKLLSEDIFDFSAEEMTTTRAKNMKQQFCGEFSSIFDLLSKVLDKATKPSLVKAALESLLRFLRWIPFGYIFETGLIERLRDRFLPMQQFRALTVACLTEIVSQPLSEQEYGEKVQICFQAVLQATQHTFPLTAELDLAAVYNGSGMEVQIFIQNLALFYSICFEKHLPFLESRGPRDEILCAHFYLLKISMVDDKEVFKVCLEYWSKLAFELFREIPFGLGANDSSACPLILGTSVQSVCRRAMYADVASQLRHVMISKMVKPEEVLVVQDENGEVVRETQKELDTLATYNSMKEVLVYLTHLSFEDMERIMRDRLESLFVPANWNFDSLNQLCWAIGSISGAMNESDEKSFLVFVISKLLSLCELKKGKSNKAIVAANVMYVVGQYPRFLKSYWKFLKTVLNKLFEFMHETHEGVQDMACETFLKISQRCKRQICTAQAADEGPFIEEIIEKLPSVTSDLTDAQKQIVYEAMASVCSIESNPERLSALIQRMMRTLNERWAWCIQGIAANADLLLQPETYKALSHILRCNTAACSAIGPAYSSQVAALYLDMLGLYRTCSSILSTQSPSAKTVQMKGLRAIKKDILRLVDMFISKIDNPSALVDSFVPPLFEAILGDYRQSVPDARDAEVLAVATTAFTKFGPLLSNYVPAVLDAVLECTLQMISRDFTEYPEHRVSFYSLLAVICSKCFSACMSLPQGYFKLMLDSIIWAFKHSMRDIADTGLVICQQLLKNIIAQSNTHFTAAFFQSFYLSLMQDVFSVLTDSSQKSGFKYQSEILSFLFSILTNGTLQVPLAPAISTPADNAGYVRDWLIARLVAAFPNLQRTQIVTFVQGLFDLNGNLGLFKSHLRDFLIQSKEFAKDDPDLFREELELEQQRKLDAQKQGVMVVPGLSGAAAEEED